MNSIDDIIAILKNGGVIAYPTEAVFGLGCDPNHENALKKIHTLKSRPKGMGLIIIASHFEMLLPYIELDKITDDRLREIRASWPGPYTWVFPAKPGFSDWLYGKNQTLAVRITAHPLARLLCDTYGTPIVSTSANLHLLPPAKTTEEVFAYFGSQIDEIIPGRLGGLTKPTEIRDALTGKVIR